MQVLILAGGQGTRLKSILQNKPKPMADIAGRPFLSYQLDYLISQGIREVFISIGHLAHVIENFYGKGYKNLKINYLQENNPLGTGGAIFYGLKNIFKTKEKDENLLVLNGDTFLDLDLKKFNFFYQDNLPTIDLAVALIHVPETARFGRVVQDDHHWIKQFSEKNTEGPGWINGGAYLISSRKITKIFEDLNQEKFSEKLSEKFSWESEVLMKHEIWGLHIAGFESNANFIDIGIPEDYARAQEILPRWAGLE